MKLLQMIDYWAKLKPETPAIVMFDMVITYGALRTAINGVAGHLSQKIADMAAPAGILIDHPARNIVVNCALMRLGVPSIVVREMQVEHLAKIGAKTLIYEGPARSLPGITTVRIEVPWFADPKAPAVRQRGTARRTKLAFTSGTTGIPKAIAFADEDIAARSNFLRAVTGDLAWTRSLIMPGLSTNFGFSQVALTLELGRTLAFAATPEDVSRAIELFGIDLLIASNQQAQSLVDYLATVKQRVRALKCVWLGGAVPTPSLLAKVNDFLCREVVCVYASTEAHVAAFGAWHQIKHVERAVGYVCPWASVECVNEHGAVLPPGKEGEIRIKTPNQGMLFGAASDPDEQIETWFYPGDRGLITADGMLVIQGRATDTINKGGVKLSASVIDQCLAGIADVTDAAVCSIQGNGDTEEVVALVVAPTPVTRDALNAALQRAKIEAVIDRAQMVDKIPRNETGKVNRDELRLLAHRK